jgi:hypothetical protein
VNLFALARLSRNNDPDLFKSVWRLRSCKQEKYHHYTSYYSQTDQSKIENQFVIRFMSRTSGEARLKAVDFMNVSYPVVEDTTLCHPSATAGLFSIN